MIESVILVKIVLGVLWKWKKLFFFVVICNVYFVEYWLRCINVRKNVKNLCFADIFVLENVGKFVFFLFVKLLLVRNLIVVMKLKNYVLSCWILVVVVKNYVRWFLIVVIFVLEIVVIVSKEECMFYVKMIVIDGVYVFIFVKNYV